MLANAGALRARDSHGVAEAVAETVAGGGGGGGGGGPGARVQGAGNARRAYRRGPVSLSEQEPGDPTKLDLRRE